MASAYRYFGIPAGTPSAEAKAQAKRTYRRLARQFHPDVAVPAGMSLKVAEAKFKELSAHYEAIADL